MTTHARIRPLIKSYTSLAKPGIIMGNLITASGAYFISGSALPHFFLLIIGLALVIAAGGTLNNIHDSPQDALMQRTHLRPIPQNLLSKTQALPLALLAAPLGIFLLTQINFLTASLAALGLFIYLALYTPLKLRTPHATFIGAFAGAIPPLCGYTAATNTLDLTALFLFLLLISWQMPHFFAIALFRNSDYKNAHIPTYPITYGISRTISRMLFYITLTILFTALLAPLALPLPILWLLLTHPKRVAKNPTTFARKNFILSLIVILGVSIVMAV